MKGLSHSVARALCAFAVVAAVVTPAAAEARTGPAALYRALGSSATWKASLPPRFSVASAVKYPSGDPGVVGEVFVYLKGPLAGQGLGFSVTTSADTAAASLFGLGRAHQAKPAPGEPAGTIWWTANEIGATSQCDSAQVTCFETSYAVLVHNVMVVAAVGSTRRGDRGAQAAARKLLAAAVARIHKLGG